MAEPSTSSFVIGAGVSSLATYVLGPVLGNYAVILGMGLIGTLVALTDEDFSVDGHPPLWRISAWKATKFIFRGLALSVAFASMGAYFAAGVIPKEYELTPYAILGPVAFTIGWTSNKWGVVKDAIVSTIGNIFSRFSNGKNE